MSKALLIILAICFLCGCQGEISAVEHGSIAEKAGLKPGDYFLSETHELEGCRETYKIKFKRGNEIKESIVVLECSDGATTPTEGQGKR